MAQLPTPPVSRENSEAPDAKLGQLHIASSPSELLQSLDALLERYLHLLDQHQKLQGKLASKLSPGFLSLAQANYACPPGRRYGADYYDERMKATRGVVLQPPSPLDKHSCLADMRDTPSHNIPTDESKQIFTIETIRHNQEEEVPERIKQIEIKQSDKVGQGHGERQTSEEQQVSEAPTISPQDSISSKDVLAVDPGGKARTKKVRSSDPIRWYGILVPPSLRSAQKSFTEAIEGPLPELASVVMEMHALEKEITRVRKELGQE